MDDFVLADHYRMKATVAEGAPVPKEVANFCEVVDQVHRRNGSELARMNTATNIHETRRRMGAQAKRAISIAFGLWERRYQIEWAPLPFETPTERGRLRARRTLEGGGLVGFECLLAAGITLPSHRAMFFQWEAKLSGLRLGSGDTESAMAEFTLYGDVESVAAVERHFVRCRETMNLESPI